MRLKQLIITISPIAKKMKFLIFFLLLRHYAKGKETPSPGDAHLMLKSRVKIPKAAEFIANMTPIDIFLASSPTTRHITSTKPQQVSPTGSDAAHFFRELWDNDQADTALTYYDTRFRPNFGGHRVKVYCSAYIGSVSSVSEQSMDFTLDFYFRQQWRDYRLAFNATKASMVSIPADFMDYLWRPPTFFVNAKYTSFHDVTRHNGFIRIKPGGFVKVMNFQYFPLDHQRCSLQIESYALPENDIVYFWTKDTDLLVPEMMSKYIRPAEASVNTSRAVVMNPNASNLAHLAIMGYSAFETYVISHDDRNHSRLVFNIYLARSLGFYFIQVYLPTSLMVMTSWISFWISRNSAPARITLSVTAVLTVVTITLQDYQSALPRLSYLKALDLFHITCFIFVFLALFEYAIVSYVSKQYCEEVYEDPDSVPTKPISKKKKKARRKSSQLSQRRKMMFNPEGELVFQRHYAKQEANERNAMFANLPSRIEVISRWLFPLAFIVFNIIYWKHYYFTHHDDMEEDAGFMRV